MKDPQPGTEATQNKHPLKTIPRKYWIIGGIVLSLVLIYALLFFIPKKVEFSYAGDTCAKQLVLFPGAQTAKSNAFEVTVKDELKIGSFTYAATKVCVTPKESPKQGSYTASTGLFGGWFAAKQFAVEVGTSPEVLASAVLKNAISPALPLRIELTQPDVVHKYTLQVADRQAGCQHQDKQLVCEVAPLALSPGEQYDLSVSRTFNGSSPAKVAQAQVTTLLPLTLKDTVLTEGKVLYDSPKEFAFTFDHPVKEATIQLTQKVGEETKTVAATTRIENETLVVVLTNDLDRKAKSTLTLKQVVAEKGNTLEEPLEINFETSGGPKPKSVSVGATNVPQTAQIVVTLDQPIKEGVDIAKFAQVTGVTGGVAKKSPTELVFTIQGGLCQSFSLVLKEGIASGTNRAVSEAWRHDARTVCGTSKVIGYSVKGRPIVAHYFGNGPETILFTGGIHGSERSGQQTMQALVDHFMANGNTIPANRNLVIVPNTNPDGIAAGSRNNANNVNVDRNFPSSNWQADIDTATGRIINGGGTAPGSEPEAKALINLTRQLRPRLSVSFHARGSLVGANQVGISVNAGNIYASTVGYGTMYGNAEEVMGYPITGEYEDWMGEELGIPAILIELPTLSGNYINSQLPALKKLLTL